MKVIVAGTRTIECAGTVGEAIRESGFNVDELVSGTCAGVDQTAEALAALHGIPVKQFPPDWKTHGKAAGPIRNRQMAEYADALVAVWDGESRGTKNMIDEMKKLGKPVHVYVVREDDAE